MIFVEPNNTPSPIEVYYWVICIYIYIVILSESALFLMSGRSRFGAPSWGPEMPERETAEGHDWRDKSDKSTVRS